MNLMLSSERRKNKRIEVSFPFESIISFPNSELDQNFSVFILDISENGIQIFSTETIFLGSDQDISFSFPSISRELKIKGVSRWIENFKNTGLKKTGFKSGIEFKNIFEDSHLDIQKIIEEINSSQKISAKNLVEKKQLIRQDRIEVENVKCVLKFENRSYQVVNYNAFGVSVVCSHLAVFPNIFHAELYVEGCLLANLRLHYKRTDTLNLSMPLLIFEILDEPLNIIKAAAMVKSAQIISNHFCFFEKQKVIPDPLKSKVYEIKNWLSLLEKDISELEKKTPQTGNEDIQKFEEGVCEMVSSLLSEIFSKNYNFLLEQLKPLSSSDRKIVLNFIRQELSSLYQAPFANRSYLKPLGYAGDYEMMNLIYRNQQEGNSLFAKCLHRYFINEPAAKSVRNRIDYMLPKFQEILVEGKTINVLSVACGPAAEIQNFLKTSKIPEYCQLEIDLLDQDLDSLKYAKRKIQEILVQYPQTIEVNYINKSIQDLIRRRVNLKKYDMIYTLGVFDYLSDSVARVCAKRLYDCLKPEGKIIIGNFTTDNPTKSTMEVPLDWDLIHRSEEQIKNLFSDFMDCIEVEKEIENINLFCIGKKLK